MRKYLFAILICLTLHIQLSAHSGKPKYHVIIDTDGAIDDMRAISMLLSGNDIRVLAITCSQGTLLPESVFHKVKSLLLAFHHEGIQVGVSEKTDFVLPLWAPFAQNINWGNLVEQQEVDRYYNSVNLLNKVTANYKDKITLIALGSLKTYADLIRENHDIINKIDRIIWYNSHTVTDGFNYKASPESYDFIQKSGISLEIVSNKSNNFTVNDAYLDEVQQCNSVYAKQIVKVHQQTSIVEKIKQNHLHLWDDFVPLYLTVPVLFDEETQEQVKFISPHQAIPESIINETISALLLSSIQTNNRVFTSFPIDTMLYKKAYAKMLSATIANYGLVEWKAIAMTNEIHGHTGIYSIIGAKMGVRAMEYFNVGVNNLRVTSFAGNKPPLSCFNDGIQISSGATIGQGLITISDSVSIVPSAIFEFNHQKIQMSVKQSIAEQMQNEIKYGVKTYGLLTDKYWLYIEELAIKYWSGFDRHEIFVIKMVE